MQTADQTDISIPAAADKDNPPPASALKQVLIVDDAPSLLLSMQTGPVAPLRFQVLTGGSAVPARLERPESPLGLKGHRPIFPAPAFLLVNTSSSRLDRACKELHRRQRQNAPELGRR